jgi:hypothetical protein
VPAQNEAVAQGAFDGTGVLQPFVRIQERSNGSTLGLNGIESGYNTEGWDAMGNPVSSGLDNPRTGASGGNHSIRLGDISTVTVCDGGGTAGANCKQYYEFLLNTNEPGTHSGISLDEFKVFTAGVGDIHQFTGADDTSGSSRFQLTGATMRYDMDSAQGGDASLLTDSAGPSGSSNGIDLQALVPVANFAGLSDDTFVYLYSKFGWAATQLDGTTGNGNAVSATNANTSAGSLDFSAGSGVEWFFSKKQAGLTPLPSTALLLLLGLAVAGAFVLCRGRTQSPSTGR